MVNIVCVGKFTVLSISTEHIVPTNYHYSLFNRLLRRLAKLENSIIPQVGGQLSLLKVEQVALLLTKKEHCAYNALSLWLQLGVELCLHGIKIVPTNLHHLDSIVQ